MKLNVKKRRRQLVAGAACSLVLGLSASCGKDSSSSEDTASTATTTTTTTTTTTSTSATTSTEAAAENTLAAAVPGNLALAAFSTSTATSLALAGEGLALADDAAASAGKPPEKEVKENINILAGKASSCLADSFSKAYSAPKEETCYEFDSDMVYMSKTNQGQTAQLYGAKKGLNANNEACLVAFGRYQIVKIKDPLKRAQDLLNAALCQAAKDEKAAAKAAGKAESTVDLIPANVGDTLNLAPYLKNALAKASRTKEVVSSIKMTRLADVADQKVYQSIFSMTDDQGNTRVFTLNHSPKDKANEEYSGILYFAVKPPKGKADPQAGPNGTADMVSYVSISYIRAKNTDGTYSMTYEARQARFTKDIDPILSSGLLDYNAGADFSVASTSEFYGRYKKADGTYYQQDNEAASGFQNISVQNTEDATGKITKQLISYWVNPGSSYKENARGMVFSAAPNATTGLMEGCATSGSASIDFSAGNSIRRVLNEGTDDISLKPRGFYHPFINTEAGGAGGGGPQSSAATSNGTGEFKYSKTQGTMTNQWVALTATGTDAVDFVTKQVAALMTSQCFKQDATSGLYVIDSTKTTGADGFDIVKTTDTVKAIAPPTPPKPKMQDIKGDFKPKEITAIATAAPT